MIGLIVGAVLIVGGILGVGVLVYLARHPKCPRCGRRFSDVVPMLRRRADSTYFCWGCASFIPFEEIRYRRFR